MGRPPHKDSNKSSPICDKQDFKSMLRNLISAHEMEYLGYNITWTSIQPIAKKVQAIQAIKTPKTHKQLRGLIGMINVYRDMWKNRASLLAPLTALMSKNVPFKWTDEHQKNFDAIKRVIGWEVLLAYTDFNAPFQNTYWCMQNTN